LIREQKVERDKQRLQEILLAKSFKLGDFTLSSGKKSDYYVDCRTATLDAEALYLISQLFLDYVEHKKLALDAAGGLTLGADPIVGGMVALSQTRARPLQGFIVRKEAKSHGTGKQVEGNLEKGWKVAIIEDVITTGASAIKAVNAAKEVGAEIEVVLAVVDREEGGREEISKLSLPVYSLFTSSELKAAARKKS
jgi:orotate phosphoribosyltransferase